MSRPKEPDAVGFHARRRRLPAENLAAQEEFVDLVREWWMPVPVTVEHREQFGGPNDVAGLFTHFLGDGFRWRLPDIDPPARNSPGAVGSFASSSSAPSSRNTAPRISTCGVAYPDPPANNSRTVSMLNSVCAATISAATSRSAAYRSVSNGSLENVNPFCARACTRRAHRNQSGVPAATRLWSDSSGMVLVRRCARLRSTGSTSHDEQIGYRNERPSP